MISYLKGKLIAKTDRYIIVDVNNVGYKVFVSEKGLSEVKEEIEAFCFLNVRESALDLYGFLTKEELELFEMLNSVRGVGPKAALKISALGSIDKIKERVLAHDDTLFDTIPGIGKKKAMTIILELSGKIRNVKESHDEAQDALVSLGFSKGQAKQALKDIDKKIKVDLRIKQALKCLGK